MQDLSGLSLVCYTRGGKLSSGTVYEARCLLLSSFCSYLFKRYCILPHGATAPSGPGPPHYQGTTITLRHTTLGRSPLDEWPAWCRDLYLTTQHSQQTDIHAPSGIRTRNPRKSAAAEPCLGLHGHWDWLIVPYCHIYVYYCNWNSCLLRSSFTTFGYEEEWSAPRCVGSVQANCCLPLLKNVIKC